MGSRPQWSVVIATVLGVAALVGCGGGSELSSSESVARYGVDDALSGVRVGACVDAQPDSHRASFGARVVSCGGSSAYAKVISRDTSRCGPGYVVASGQPISVAAVNGESVCIEQLDVNSDQVMRGLPGSPRARCLAQADSASGEMRCYQKRGTL